jgi:DNA sulfur modification protein DndD
MLAIRSISLTDFGPFKDEQRIEFPTDNGVSIIYGENMRGKTTLLNAIRYALFGRVFTRGAVQLGIHQIGNWETAKEKGKYGFKVVLEFEHEKAKYALTREHKPRSGVKVPESDFDYTQEVFLSRNGTVLGPDETQSELARIMPETVSRFFLFDGELLQQYEELLRNESEMGRSIKESIERILGVPVLTNGRADLGELFKDAQRREAKAAQKNQKTQVLGNQHEALLKQRDGLQEETNRLKKDWDRLKQDKASKEELLRKTEKTKALLDERSRLLDEIATSTSKLQEKVERRQELLAVAWKGLLNGRIRATRDVLEQELKEKRDAHSRAVVTNDLSQKLKEALQSGECSTCGQQLSSVAKDRLAAIVAEALPEAERIALEARIQQIDVRVTSLRQSEAPGNTELLTEVQNSIDELKIKASNAEDRLGDIKEQTKDLDETEVRKMYIDYDNIVAEMRVLQDGIKKQDEEVRRTIEQIEKVEGEMKKFTDTDLDLERERKELCEGLRALFATAVDAYRDRLRGKVEKDATALFLKLTSEPEYKSLSINDSYGLMIVHKDGTTIPVRSAGAEHIVALSLMGALQRNAPLRGPIVMDSPFGRLDQTHTAKVIEALPGMADQVMLLVYESELDRTQARGKLQGKLRKEYQITRRSARHSTLEAMS